MGEIELYSRVMAKGIFVKSKDVDGCLGTVILVRRDECLVEFDDNVGGHDGFNTYGVTGKPGHCWYINYGFLELVDDDKSEVCTPTEFDIKISFDDI